MPNNRSNFLPAALVVLIAVFCFISALRPAFAQAAIEDTPQVEARVNALLSKLTLEEKIGLLGGVDKFYIRGLPSIGLPPLRMSDGPMGVRTWGKATAYPGGMALAASWDPNLADEIGAAMGRDARARGVYFLLAPGVNITRAPMAGRSFEYFGEDPVLAAHMAVGFIEGVQGQGVIATVKHFAANNEEYNRVEVSSDVSERTLHELYLPAFEAAVKQGHVGAVMDSYNPVNGIHPTQNVELNCDILKKDWQFDGIVMSDWGATHNGVAAANACLDLEMPAGLYMNRQTLLPAIHDGKVSLATIDDKVRRILRKAVQFGFFDRPQLDLSIPLYSSENRKMALKGALESITLLKNDDALLPLDASAVRTLAVIGPNATPAVYAGGGSSKVTAYEAVSTLAGLMDYLDGKADVKYDPGLPDLDELSTGTQFTFDHKPGVQLQLFTNPDFSGNPLRTITVPNIAPGSLAATLNADETLADGVKALRFTGTYVPRGGGNYLFLTSGAGPEYASGRDKYKLFVDSTQIAAMAPFEAQVPLATYRDLTYGKPVQVRFDYVPATSHAYPRLAIASMADLISERAKQIAQSADAVVIAVGFDSTTEREGMDRTFELPYGQEELIRTIARLNKKTIVVVNSGGGVDMHRWVDSVPAIFYEWYPGQEGGVALAKLLFGDHNPEGRLPVTIDRTWQDSPVHNSYYPKKRSQSSPEGAFVYDMGGFNHPGKVEEGIEYKEGLLNGYRFYAGSSEKPLFPFGFGLSYTTFSVSNLRVGELAENGLDVSVDVTNTGSRDGTQVVQLYVGLPSDHVPMPERELKAFQKVSLQPDETTHVSLHLDPHALSYYDVAAKAWKLDTGEAKVFVGDSAENTPLSGQFNVAP